MPADEDLLVTNGAYVISEFVEDQYLTLTANAEYEGDHKAGLRQGHGPLQRRPDGPGQALQNGEVDLIGPQATADVLTAVEGIDGVEVATRSRGHVRARRPAVHQRWPVRPGDLRRRRGEGQGGPPGVPHDDPASADHREPDRAARPRGRGPQLVHPGAGSPNYDAIVAANGSGRDVRDGHPRRQGAARRGRRAAPSTSACSSTRTTRAGRTSTSSSRRRPPRPASTSSPTRSRPTGARTSRTRRASTTPRSSAGSRSPPL